MQNCNSSSHQCAWPNTSDACFNITRPDQCGEGLARRTCGHVFYVTSQCSGSCVSVSIADCGPDTNSFCGERSCCGSACASNRLIDLTPLRVQRDRRPFQWSLPRPNRQLTGGPRHAQS